MDRGRNQIPPSEADAKTRSIEMILAATPGARKQRAEREAAIIALEYRQTRLDPELDHDFRAEVESLPGADYIAKYVILCMYHDPDLFWLDDDVDLFTGIVAAIHLLARGPLWRPAISRDALVATIRDQWMGPNVSGLHACRVVYDHRQAA